VATKAAGTPAARFLPLSFSSLGQLVQPLNIGCINSLVAVTSPNLNVTLEDSAIRQMALRAPPGGVQGSRHCPHDGLARGKHVLFAQESRAQVRGRNGIDDDGACLL
jgi:hypothetical protein